MQKHEIPAPDFRISRFQAEHVPEFLAMAEQEGWVCDRWEFDFLITTFPHGGYVALKGGHALAFVTSVKHERSGWIGNLMVHGEHRGKGLGRMMFNLALAGLKAAGVETIWLTASEEGRRLYESVGFQPIDTIVRWRGFGSYKPSDAFLPESGLAITVELDKEGWGDRRSDLLRAISSRSPILVDSDGFLVFQQTNSGIQLGPWSSRKPAQAESLLAKGLQLESSATRHVILDSPSKNTFSGKLLSSAGFSQIGSTVLMFRGKKPEYRPASIFALASMGSMG